MSPKQSSFIEGTELPTLHKYARAYRDADDEHKTTGSERDKARDLIVAYMKKHKIKIYQHGNVSIEVKESRKLKVEVSDPNATEEEEE